MTTELRDLLDELEILKEDVNHKIYNTINQFDNNYLYKYFEYYGNDKLIVNKNYGSTKDDFEKKFTKTEDYETLSELRIAGYMEHKNGFIIKITENNEVKDKKVELLILDYINKIFQLLRLNSSRKIEFENFIHTFVLVSNKYSNNYDNALFDLDNFVVNKRKLKFVLDNFR